MEGSSQADLEKPTFYTFFLKIFKITVRPLLNIPQKGEGRGALLFQAHLRGEGLSRDRGLI